MKLLFISGFLLLTFVEVSGQIGIPFQNAVWRGSTATVEGSPFLEDNWKIGTVTDAENDKEYRVFLKYDTQIDRILVSSYGRASVLNDERYPRFTMGFLDDAMTRTDREFVNASRLEYPELEGYYEVLHDGDFRLLRKVRTDYIPNTIPEYGTHRKVQLYLTREDNFLITPEGKLYEVPGKEKNIFPLFQQNEEYARTLANQNGLDVKNTNELVKLLALLEERI